MITKRLFAITVLAICGLLAVEPSPAAVKYSGVNLAGAEFQPTALPGTFNSNYTYPNQTEVNYFKGKGMNSIRLPFLWERLQPTLNNDFASAEAGRIASFVSAATANGMYVIL